MSAMSAIGKGRRYDGERQGTTGLHRCVSAIDNSGLGTHEYVRNRPDPHMCSWRKRNSKISVVRYWLFDYDILAYPTVTCGVKIKFKVPFTPCQILKSDLRKYDRRGATYVPWLFTNFAESRLRRLVSRAIFALRKSRKEKIWQWSNFWILRN